MYENKFVLLSVAARFIVRVRFVAARFIVRVRHKSGLPPTINRRSTEMYRFQVANFIIVDLQNVWLW
jgi:hypothetical protein